MLGGLRVPEELSARVPAEERGAGRDDVRLLVSRGTEVAHHAFRELAGLLRAGDVLVVNTSPTLPAAEDRVDRGGSGCGPSPGSRPGRRFGLRSGRREPCGGALLHRRGRPALGRRAPQPRGDGGHATAARRARGDRGGAARRWAAGAGGTGRARRGPAVVGAGVRRGRAGRAGLLDGTGGPSGTGTRSGTSRCRRTRRSSRCPAPTGRARRRCRARGGPSRRRWWRSW